MYQGKNVKRSRILTVFSLVHFACASKISLNYLLHLVDEMLITVVWIMQGLVIAHSLWHAYDHEKRYENCINQTAIGAAGSSAIMSRKEEWKLWPDITSTADAREGEMLYGFNEGIQAIWDNQHPIDCSKANFLISGGFESGFGSEFHVIGAGLALAMRMKRVYVMLADQGDSALMDKMRSINNFQVDTEFCRKQKHLNLDCYYEPWSSCTLEDALRGTTMQALRDQQLHIPFNDLMSTLNRTERSVIVHLSPDLIDTIPPVLEQTVECSPMHRERYKYWWRSVSVAYLMRPNELTRQLILMHRQDPEMRFDQQIEQCVSVHIRRGDKHLEMKVIEDDTIFYEEARRLWENIKNRTHITQEKGVIFLGTEDAGVIDSALAWGAKNNFEIRYANLFDRRSVTTGLNNDLQQAARKNNAFVHDEWEYFNMILTLDGHLRCSAFVCTQRSNYCRIIDELRATVGHKINKQYADFSCHGGMPPACVDSPLTGIGWR